jgi:dolichol-phosphate mannosyltransferase
MKKKILIATATYNEVLNIERLVKKIFKLNNQFNLFIVDDNSPDGTYLILRKLSKEFKNLKILIRNKKKGLNTAHVMIFNEAIKNKYDYLITMDADFSHDPNDIKKIIQYLDSFDFVIGSRYIKGGKSLMSFSRYIISKYGNRFIKFFLNTKLSENTTSFRGFNLNRLRKLKVDLNHINSNGYSFFMEVIFYLIQKKCTIKEFPIVFKDRKHGISKISKVEIFRTLKNLFRLKFNSLFKRNLY